MTRCDQVGPSRWSDCSTPVTIVVRRLAPAGLHTRSVRPPCSPEPMLSVLIVACDFSGQAPQVTDALLPGDRQELEDTYRLG